jgi:hypothetical protein
MRRFRHLHLRPPVRPASSSGPAPVRVGGAAVLIAGGTPFC